MLGRAVARKVITGLLLSGQLKARLVLVENDKPATEHGDSHAASALRGLRR